MYFIRSLSNSILVSVCLQPPLLSNLEVLKLAPNIKTQPGMLLIFLHKNVKTWLFWFNVCTRYQNWFWYNVCTNYLDLAGNDVACRVLHSKFFSCPSVLGCGCLTCLFPFLLFLFPSATYSEDEEPQEVQESGDSLSSSPDKECRTPSNGQASRTECPSPFSPVDSVSADFEEACYRAGVDRPQFFLGSSDDEDVLVTVLTQREIGSVGEALPRDEDLEELGPHGIPNSELLQVAEKDIATLLGLKVSFESGEDNDSLVLALLQAEWLFELVK